MEPKFSKAPYYSRLTDRGDRVIHDIHSRPIALVLPDSNRDRAAATERVLRHAPSVYMTLRAVRECLDKDGRHEELVRHIDRTLELVEPELRCRRLDYIYRSA